MLVTLSDDRHTKYDCYRFTQLNQLKPRLFINYVIMYTLRGGIQHNEYFYL